MRTLRIHILVPCALALAASLAGIAGFMLWQAHQAAWQQARQQADNISLALERDVARSIEVFDLSLRTAAMGLRLVHLTADNDLRRAVLFDGALAARHFGRVRVLDENGAPLYDSLSPQPEALDDNARAVFMARAHESGDALVMTPLPQGDAGRPDIMLSRRVLRPDGSFAGLVMGTIHVSLFAELFGALHLGPRDDVSVATADGRIVYRRLGGTADFGRDISASPLFLQSRQASNGLLDGPSVLDGVRRLIAYRYMTTLPMLVAVGLARNDIFASWYGEAAMIGAAQLALIALAGLLAWSLQRELHRRSLAEAAARESEASYRLLAEHAHDMVSRVGADGQRRYVSPAARRIFGLPPEALLGTGLLERTRQEDRPAVQAAAASMLAGEVAEAGATFRARRADGSECWIEATGRTLRDTRTGAPDGFVSIARDITERRHTEALLRESESRYRHLAASTSDLMTALDLDFCRTYVSPAARRIFGYAPEEMLGMSITRTMHPDDVPVVVARLRRLAGGGVDEETSTYRALHKDGHEIWVEAIHTLSRDPQTGAPVSITGTVRDITIRKAQDDALLAANATLERLSRHLSKARDAAERASRAKSRFLAGMSHELRTPLNGILGYAQLLRLEGGLNATQTTRLDAMLGAGEHLLLMINRVLDLSEIEAEHVELHTAETEPGALAASCLDLVRPAAAAKALALRMAVAPDVPASVLVDQTRLRQIVLNLLGNAVKFTPAGSVLLEVSLPAAGMFRVDVVDTGPGIPAAMRSHLFHEFERLGASGATEGVEGTGLGLALSARLAAVMGGRLTYEDNPGGGAIFRLELPLVTAATATPAAVAPPPPVAAPRRVLVVDDVAMNRDIAASFLRAVGHDVTMVADGAAAVAMAADSDFDMVLMDVRMPGMDGLEATRRIRALAGPRGKIPIVALTAQAFAEQIAACRDAGMTGHLAKPFTQAALLAVVADAAAPPTAPASEPPGAILHAEVFAATAKFLSPEMIASYMQILIDRCVHLLDAVRAPDVRPDDLATTAHALAGSAGMFGFERLATACRGFEHALQSSPREPAAAAAIETAIETALPELRRHLSPELIS